MKEKRIAFENMKAAIFDMDGTLTDSMPLWKNIGVKYLESLGITPKEDLFSALKTLSLEESAAYFQKEYGINKTVQEILDGANGLLRHAYEHTVPLKPGVTELLEKLGIPSELLGEISLPGTLVGTFTKEIEEKVGFSSKVIFCPSHDTASAVAACPMAENSLFSL